MSAIWRGHVWPIGLRRVGTLIGILVFGVACGEKAISAIADTHECMSASSTSAVLVDNCSLEIVVPVGLVGSMAGRYKFFQRGCHWVNKSMEFASSESKLTELISAPCAHRLPITGVVEYSKTLSTISQELPPLFTRVKAIAHSPFFPSSPAS